MFSKGSTEKIESRLSGASTSPKPKATTSMPSIVSPGLQITGNMISEGDMQIEGSVEGDVKSRVLTVGETGAINGKVEADQAFISGTVTGQIAARSLSLTKSARVSGDIAHETISIEAGAMVEGQLKYLGKSKAAPDSFESVKKQIKDVSSSSSPGSTAGGPSSQEDAKPTAGQKV